MQPSFTYELKQPGGYATGIIKAPAKSVWLVVKNFHSLAWWDPKWTVVQVEPAPEKLRNVQIRTFPPDLLHPWTDTLEELLVVAEKETFFEVSYVKKDFKIIMPTDPATGKVVNKPFPLVKLEEAMNGVRVVSTLRFEDVPSPDHGTTYCRFTFSADVWGPLNLVRLMAQFQQDNSFEVAVARLAA
jgi:hypothetical protein